MTVYLARGGWVVRDERGKVIGRGETRDAALRVAESGGRRRNPGYRGVADRLRREAARAGKVDTVGFFKKGTR